MPSSDVVVADSTHGLLQIKLESSHMNYDAVSVFVDDDTANCSPFTVTIYTAANLIDDLSTRITAMSSAVTSNATALASLSSAVNSSGVVLKSCSTGAIGVNALTDAAWNRLGIVAFGTAQAADSTSITLASSHAFASDELNGAVVYISGDTGVGQSRSILDYASDKAIVDTWTTTPAATATYVVFAAPPASAVNLPAVNLTQVAGSAVNTATAQIGANVVSMDTNALSAAAVSAGAVSKISSGLATSTEVSSGFAAQTAILSTMAAAVALRATSTEVSSGFAAQTAILSTMATAVLGVSTQVGRDVKQPVHGGGGAGSGHNFRARGRAELDHRRWVYAAAAAPRATPRSCSARSAAPVAARRCSATSMTRWIGCRQSRIRPGTARLSRWC